METPAARTYPPADADQVGRDWSCVTTNEIPPTVRTMTPGGTTADCSLAMKDVNVTRPVAGVPGSRVIPKSLTKLSQSEPVDVARRVRSSDCSTRYCNHRPIPPTLSIRARAGEPMDTSSNWEQEACAAVTAAETVVEKERKERDIASSWSGSVTCRSHYFSRKKTGSAADRIRHQHRRRCICKRRSLHPSRLQSPPAMNPHQHPPAPAPE